MPGTSRFHCCPGKEEKRRSSATLILKKNFSVASPAPAHRSFEAAPEEILFESGTRRSDRDMCDALVFKGVQITL